MLVWILLLTSWGLYGSGGGACGGDLQAAVRDIRGGVTHISTLHDKQFRTYTGLAVVTGETW